MSEINLFEIASRSKFRFETRRGEITAEQLWDIALTGADSVDAIAVGLNDALQKSSTKSFVTASTATDKELQLKFDLVKYVISVRVAEVTARAAKAEKASKRKALNEAIAAKENEELLSGSVEELKKRRAELDD